MAGVYSVGQINSYIKNMFRQDFVLSRISVKGEISNCKYHTSGHVYFTIKDESGTLSAIMFASQAAKLTFRLENGMQVIVTGRIDVYERDGRYQLYASGIKQDGLGDLYIRFEQLKREYEQMGYFANEYKRHIPLFSKKIGIVTASTGAAIHDIMNIAYRRNPYVSLILYPALVQGDNAKYSIVKGIETLDKMGLDVVIAGRGGGSIEDLWAFNEPMVVEAVFDAKTPIISAVGHETDFTITDFVADLRAPTPSAAAELAVADISLIEQKIMAYNEALNSSLMGIIDGKRNYLDKCELKLRFLSPSNQLDENRQRLMGIEDSLNNIMMNKYKDARHRLQIYASRLQEASPLTRLSAGYAYVQNENGEKVSSVRKLKRGDKLKVQFKDGYADTSVDSVTAD
jgi:exodeoxyribonuclease VII large subunit